MSFQTVFYLKSSGRIINVIPNRYIRSVAEKARLCPKMPTSEVNLVYFKSDIPVDMNLHHAVLENPFHPPVIVVESGVPLFLAHWREPFLEAKAKFKTIIVNMSDGLGDNLFRAAAVVAAQKRYPDIKFYCAVYQREYDIMALCPGIELFHIPDGELQPTRADIEARGLAPDQCGHIILRGGVLWDERGAGYSKSAHFGLQFDIPHVAYNTKLVLPPDFDQGFTAFSKKIGLAKAQNPVVLQLRTKNTDDRGWSIDQVKQLADMIKAVHKGTIYYLGDPADMPDDYPNLVNLVGKTTWLETVYLLTKAAKVICIDSAVLHLCRGLGIPYFCLWGHTDPLRTLGVPAGPQDIGSGFGTPLSLMSNITPLQVFNRAFSGNQD
jgi:hypothetical protein